MDYKDSFDTKISEIHAVLTIIQNYKKKLQFSLYKLIYFYGVDLLHNTHGSLGFFWYQDFWNPCSIDDYPELQ